MGKGCDAPRVSPTRRTRPVPLPQRPDCCNFYHRYFHCDVFVAHGPDRKAPRTIYVHGSVWESYGIGFFLGSCPYYTIHSPQCGLRPPGGEGISRASQNQYRYDAFDSMLRLLPDRARRNTRRAPIPYAWPCKPCHPVVVFVRGEGSSRKPKRAAKATYRFRWLDERQRPRLRMIGEQLIIGWPA